MVTSITTVFTYNTAHFKLFKLIRVCINMINPSVMLTLVREIGFVHRLTLHKICYNRVFGYQEVMQNLTRTCKNLFGVPSTDKYLSTWQLRAEITT